MSQTDRKYDGPPINELRKEAAPTPPPPAYRERGKKPKGKGPIVTTDIYWRWHAKPSSWKDRRHDKVERSPFSGVSRGMWGEWWMSHVINRMKLIVKRDLRSDILWMEYEATKAQASPEFATRNGLIHWLEFEGISRGLLKVVSYPDRRGRPNDLFYKECG